MPETWRETMTDTMRERLARAACKADRSCACNSVDECEAWDCEALTHVDAILAELQEPSEGMNDAAVDATFLGAGMSWHNRTPQQVARHVMKAMIQHIRDGGK